MSKASKKLVVEFDVTGLSKAEVGELELEVIAQGEESDGQGGKHYSGEAGHPPAPVLGSKFVRDVKLVIEFDVTGWRKDQIGWLASEVEVQAESSDGHPSVGVVSHITR